METLGEAIEQARRARRLQVQELARLLGVSAGMVSRYEGGTVLPSLPVLRRLFEVLALPEAEQRQWYQAWEAAELAKMRRKLKGVASDGAGPFPTAEPTGDHPARDLPLPHLPSPAPSLADVAAGGPAERVPPPGLTVVRTRASTAPRLAPEDLEALADLVAERLKSRSTPP